MHPKGTCFAAWASPPTYRLPKAYAYPTGRTEPSAPTPGFPAANALSKPNQRPKARFDNRPTPVGVSKEGGPRPSLFGRFKERGFLRGEGNRNPSPLKPFFGYFLSGKKVTRRRQQREEERNANGQGRTPPLQKPKEGTPPEAKKRTDCHGRGAPSQ